MECGKQIRACMEAWAAGLGKIQRISHQSSLMERYFPSNANLGRWLVQKWYTGPDDVGDVLALPEDVPVDIGPDPTGKWAGGKATRPGRSPAWAWRWTLEECSSRMSTLLADNFLPPLDGPMVHEHAWKIATSLKGRDVFTMQSTSLNCNRYSRRCHLHRRLGCKWVREYSLLDHSRITYAASTNWARGD